VKAPVFPVQSYHTLVHPAPKECTRPWRDNTAEGNGLRQYLGRSQRQSRFVDSPLTQRAFSACTGRAIHLSGQCWKSSPPLPQGVGQRRIREVFYSNTGAPLIRDIIKAARKFIREELQVLEDDKDIKRECRYQPIARRSDED